MSKIYEMLSESLDIALVTIGCLATILILLTIFIAFIHSLAMLINLFL
jgi:hypothetical protein